nr:xyloglucan endotransglucosylase/hydrolase protein 31-like [Ipomoea batatas]
MALLLSLAIIFLFTSSNNAQGPPSPGYYPSTKVGSLGFYQGFRNLWGPEHQSLDQGTLSIWLDKAHGGSGFKSLKSYGSGYIGASIKLQPGYTAGVITCLYLSNIEQHPNDHDEIDIEFLGTTPGKPYTLQTNVYMKGSGDGGNIIGREVRFNLWFDPTQDFHHYAILWNPSEIMSVILYPHYSTFMACLVGCSLGRITIQ